MWAFVVNDPTRLTSVVERPDGETKLQVFVETLETGRVRIRHFLIRLTPQHGGRVRTETVLRSKPPHVPKRR